MISAELVHTPFVTVNLPVFSPSIAESDVIVVVRFEPLASILHEYVGLLPAFVTVGVTETDSLGHGLSMVCRG